MRSPTLAGFPALAANNGPSAARVGEGALVVRVVVRTPTVETFIQKYSRFVKEDRIFIFTKSSQPPGTRLRFTLELADGKPLVSGEGTVTRVRDDVGDTARPPGMELRFVPSDENSRKIVDLLLAERGAPTGEPSSTHRAPPVAAAANLPVLPLTAGHAVYDETPAPDRPAPGKPAPRPTEPREASPLLTRALANGPKGLPSRPGTLARSAPGPSVTTTAPSGASATAAACVVPAAVILPVILPVNLPVAVLEPTGASASSEGIEDEATQVGAESEVRRSAIDADSLFAMSEVASSSKVDDEVGGKTDAVPVYDELAHSFPGLAQPAAFTESWREALPEGAVGFVPANPFSDVSDGAIEFFVEWSLERSTAPVSDAKNETTAFGAVQMRPPEQEADELDVRSASRRGTSIGLVIGLGIGLVTGGIGVVVALGRRGPTAASSPGASLRSPGGTAPTPKEPEARPVAAAPAPAEPAPLAAEAARQVAPAILPPTAARPIAAGRLIVAPSTGAAGEANNVRLSSKPPSATVSIDGAERGKTPLGLALSPGPHQILISLDRYAAFTSSLTAPGELEATLKRPLATLSVTSTPPGAVVIVNRQRRGKTPLSLPVPAYESYNLELSLAGAKPWKRRVYVKTPSTTVAAALVLSRPTTSARTPEPIVPRGRGIR